MAILVTGGAGYIGSHMVHELTDAGESVVVLDNLSTGFRFLLPSTVAVVVGNTGDQELVAEIIQKHRVESIIHFAASIVVPDSVRDPLGYYRNNTANARALIEASDSRYSARDWRRVPRHTALAGLLDDTLSFSWPRSAPRLTPPTDTSTSKRA